MVSPITVFEVPALPDMPVNPKSGIVGFMGV